MRLKPFFSYFGSKWSNISKYPAPRHGRIIEPFAGSASYALHYPDKEILLVDKDEIICGVWDYLIHVSADEILRLPDVNRSVDDLDLPQEAKWLIGFCLNKACTGPRKTPSKWLRTASTPDASLWGDLKRRRIASQLEYIRHWQIRQTDYTTIENQTATWFIDPPYDKQGFQYRVNDVNYQHLANWVYSRLGQTIVCEQLGADWMPFQPIGNFPSARAGTTSEVVFYN